MREPVYVGPEGFGRSCLSEEPLALMPWDVGGDVRTQSPALVTVSSSKFVNECDQPLSSLQSMAHGLTRYLLRHSSSVVALRELGF